MLRITSGRISFPGRHKNFPTNEELQRSKDKQANILHTTFLHSIS